jgi:hypothetical protein
MCQRSATVLAVQCSAAAATCIGTSTDHMGISACMHVRCCCCIHTAVRRSSGSLEGEGMTVLGVIMYSVARSVF